MHRKTQTIGPFKLEHPENPFSEHFQTCTMFDGPDNYHTIVQYIRYELLVCQNQKWEQDRMKHKNI